VENSEIFGITIGGHGIILARSTVVCTGDDGWSRVGEHHIVEADRGIRGQRRGGFDGTVELGFTRQADDLLDATERAECLVHGGDGAESLAERHDQHEQEENEGHEISDGDGTACHAEAADAENHEQRHLQCDASDRHHECRDFRHLDAHLPSALRILLDRGSLAVGGVGGTHGADCSECALHGGGEVPDLLLLLAARDPHSAGQEHHRDDRDGDHQHGEAEEHRIDDQHGDQRPEEDEGAADRVHEALGEHRVEQGRVRADAGDEVAGASGVEFADREPKHPPYQLSAGR